MARHMWCFWTLWGKYLSLTKTGCCTNVQKSTDWLVGCARLVSLNSVGRPYVTTSRALPTSLTIVAHLKLLLPFFSQPVAGWKPTAQLMTSSRLSTSHWWCSQGWGWGWGRSTGSRQRRACPSSTQAPRSTTISSPPLLQCPLLSPLVHGPKGSPRTCKAKLFSQLVFLQDFLQQSRPFASQGPPGRLTDPHWDLRQDPGQKNLGRYLPLSAASEEVARCQYSHTSQNIR